MTNFDHAILATETALNSAGSAARENERYMEGLEARTNALKASFEKLSNQVVDSNIVKIILSLSKGLVDLGATGMGAVLIQGGLLTGLLWGGTGLIKAMDLVGKFTSASAISFNLFGKALAFSGPQVMLFMTGISLLVGLFPELSKLLEDSISQFRIWSGDLKHINDKIEESESKLKNNKDRLEELNAISWYDRTPEIQKEIDSLKEENIELQKNIDNWKQLTEGTERKVGADRFAFKQEGFETNTSFGTASTVEELVGKAPYLVEHFVSSGNLEEDIKTLERLGYSIEQVRVQLQSTEEESNKFYSSWSTSITKQMEEMLISGEINEEQLNKIGAEYNTIIEEVGKYVEAYKNSDKILNENQKTLIKNYDAMLESGQILQEFTDGLDKASEALTFNKEQYQNLIALYPQLNDYVKQTGDSYRIEAQALLEALNANEQWAWSLVSNQKSATVGAIEQVKARILAYEQELKMLNSLANIPFLNKFGGFSEKASSIEQSLVEAKDTLAKLEGIMQSSSPGLVGGGSGGGGSKGKTLLEQQNELYRKQLELLKDKHEILEKSGASEEELIESLKNIQAEIERQRQGYYQQGLTDEHEYIRDLISLWWDYENEIKQIQISVLEDKKAVYEKLFGYMSKQISKEIDSLRKQRQEEEQYWDEKIEALKAQNEEINRQIELEKIQEQLARAKQTKLYVYKDGKFQYLEDVDAISQAQVDLEAYERDEALRQEVENLEKLKEQALASIDAQIESWEKYKEEWESVVDSYAEEQDRLLIEQELGIELEGENWKERLDKLEEYIEQYEALMRRLAKAQSSANSGLSGGGSGGSRPSGGGSSGSSGGGGSRPSGGSGSKPSNKPSGGGSKPGGVSGAVGDFVGGVSGSIGSLAGSIGSIIAGGKHAGGAISAPGGISLVGEKGPELRVLNRGDGILPNDIVGNLWAWGEISPQNLVSSLSNLSLGGGVSISIENFNPNLPNVTNGEEFAHYLKNNFWRQTLQFVKK